MIMLGKIVLRPGGVITKAYLCVSAANQDEST